MKVALMIPTLRKGGAERTVSNLSLNLPEDIEQDIILFSKNTCEYPHKARIIELDIPSSGSLIGKAGNFIRRVSLVRKIKQENRYDAVISFMEGPNFVNVLSRRNERVILSVRNYLESSSAVNGKLLTRMTGLMIRLLYNRADQIVCVSEEIRKSLLSKYKVSGERLITINNFVSVSEALKQEPLQEDGAYFDHESTIITVGRLNRQKGQWHLLRAFQALRQSTTKDVQLVVLGEGELLDPLKSLSQQLGISDAVQFLGVKKNPFPYYEKADLFVLTSLWEGFPNVLLEAMACGLPVVSTSCKSGTEEIIAGSDPIRDGTWQDGYENCKYGILIPEFGQDQDLINTEITPEELILAKAMQSMIEDRERNEHYRRQAVIRVKDFSLERIMMRWISLLRQNG